MAALKGGEKSKMSKSKWITIFFSPLKNDKKMNINENNIKHSSIGRSPQDQLTCFHPPNSAQIAFTPRETFSATWTKKLSMGFKG